MNSLGLAGDGDESDLIDDVALCFGVSFHADELAQIITVGDLHHALANRFARNADDLKGRGSGPAIAFFKLRAALRAMSKRKAALTPGTPLNNLINEPAKVILASLEKETGLNLPEARRWLIGDWCFVAAIFPAIYALYKMDSDPLVATIVLVASGVVLVRRDAGKFPVGAETLGKLATQTAALSFGHLAKDGAATRDSDIWAALRLIIAPHTNLATAKIGAETRLLATSPVRGHHS